MREELKRISLATAAVWSLICLVLYFGIGCAQFSTQDEAQNPPVGAGANAVPVDFSWTTHEGFTCRAVVAGLTFVDPSAYNGWAGECPGCDTDCEVFAEMARERGADVRVFHNEQATQENLISAAVSAWKDMKAGDLFVFYISGHGGQIEDTDNDEEDGKDETICLWDGQMSDDVLRSLWEQVPAGVRVFMVTDTCNSGTNYRLIPLISRSIRQARSFDGALIHYGGCADGESSYGDSSGGTFTTALVDAWADGQNYVTWFDEARKIMPRHQIPTYAEFVGVTDQYRNSEPFK